MLRSFSKEGYTENQKIKLNKVEKKPIVEVEDPLKISKDAHSPQTAQDQQAFTKIG